MKQGRHNPIQLPKNPLKPVLEKLRATVLAVISPQLDYNVPRPRSNVKSVGKGVVEGKAARCLFSWNL